MRMYLDATPGQGQNMSRQNLIRTIGFDKYSQLVPYSSLAAELVNRLLKLPQSCYENETASFNYPFLDKKQELQKSCMFSPDPDVMDPTGSQSWYKSRQMWNRMKGSQSDHD